MKPRKGTSDPSLGITLRRSVSGLRRAVRGSVYSCFEKGCPTKPYATMPKGIMGSRGLRYLIEALGVSAT